MNDRSTNILIVGVGGQGVLLASEVLSLLAMEAGLDVKKSEVHGMSQRGGVVSSHVRIGKKVYSPTIGHGEADVLMSFEIAECLRALPWMKPDGTAITSHTRLVPPITTIGKFSYPDDPIAMLREKTKNLVDIDADAIALELGNSRLVNTILLGILSNLLDMPEGLWLDVIRKRVPPKFVDLNLEAFKRGRSYKPEIARVGG
jgi:indolepyruvate ferredoxin oxidoreductase beta subunit